MHSSRRSISDSDRQVAVRGLVAERAGRQWCLFLDRDGVINRHIVGDYVRRWSDFEWLPRARPALKELRLWAPHVVVVTNQQGIGKGLMTGGDVATIHSNLEAQLAAGGVIIDAIRVCPHLESARCACRKPQPALALDWLKQHPEIDQSLSIMVGDSPSDLEMANRIAVVTGGCASIRIGVGTSRSAVADASFSSLWDFALAVRRGHE